MPATIALFDIDGTLLRAGGAGRRALERAVGEALGGREEVSLASVEFAGRTDPWIVRSAFTQYGVTPEDSLVDEVLRRYVSHLPEQLALAEAFEVLPGVTALLGVLFERDDVVLGLGTGNTETAAYAKLARGQLDSFFSFGGFGSDHSERPRVLRAGLERGLRKVQGSTEVRAVVIGDTPHDIDAARAIGAPCVAVSTGSFDADVLRAAGAEAVVETLEAPEVLAAFG